MCFWAMHTLTSSLLGDSRWGVDMVMVVKSLGVLAWGPLFPGSIEWGQLHCVDWRGWDKSWTQMEERDSWWNSGVYLYALCTFSLTIQSDTTCTISPTRVFLVVLVLLMYCLCDCLHIGLQCVSVHHDTTLSQLWVLPRWGESLPSPHTHTHTYALIYGHTMLRLLWLRSTTNRSWRFV